MAGEVRDYAPGAHNVIFGGHQGGGFADDTFIEIEEIGDGIQSGSGADGETWRSMPAIQRFRITITLNQTSPSNTVLSGFYQADRLSNGGGALPLLIEDVTGQSELAAGQAWVTKFPNASWSKQADNTRAWVIETGGVSGAVLGGNQA